jgi:hypothetical protein
VQGEAPNEAAVRQRLRELAEERRRFGYRRLGWMLARREGHAMNHKKLYRLCPEEQLMLRRRKTRKRALGTRAPMMPPGVLTGASDHRGVASRLQSPPATLEPRRLDAQRVRDAERTGNATAPGGRINRRTLLMIGGKLRSRPDTVKLRCLRDLQSIPAFVRLLLEWIFNS